MKKVKKLSVTIGIPAYNEAANIGTLLYALMKQKTATFKLESVIIVSDGSTDNTVNEIEKVSWKKIKIVKNTERLGLNPTENKIISETKSDILLLLDADILPKSSDFIEQMILPFSENTNLGIVGADTLSIKGEGFVEKVLAKSHELKKYIYRQINSGNNIYHCHGRARAFSRKYYSKLKFPENCPEDAYSFLECIKNGLGFVHAKNAQVLFRSPTNIKDQVKQSKRFKGGMKILIRHFGKTQVEKSFQIPPSILLKTLTVFLIKQPFYTLAYLSIVFYIRFINRIPSLHRTKYETSVSTKKLIVEKGLI